MQKLALPLVMVATLATLVSCGQQTGTTVTTPSVPAPVVTGAVVTPTAASGTVAPVSAAVFTRKETVSYNTPEGLVPVEFDVTVTDGIITEASANTLATTTASKYNQDKFTAGLSAAVVGKKAKDLSVDAIGGASLTTAAFEQFVQSF